MSLQEESLTVQVQLAPTAGASFGHPAATVLVDTDQRRSIQQRKSAARTPPMCQAIAQIVLRQSLSSTYPRSFPWSWRLRTCCGRQTRNSIRRLSLLRTPMSVTPTRFAALAVWPLIRASHCWHGLSHYRAAQPEVESRWKWRARSDVHR